MKTFSFSPAEGSDMLRALRMQKRPDYAIAALGAAVWRRARDEQGASLHRERATEWRPVGASRALASYSTVKQPWDVGPSFGSGAGWPVSFVPLKNEGSDAPRRRVVRITPDGPDDHSGRTRIAGSWRISGCAAPTRRATRHLPLARSGPVGPSRCSFCRGEPSRVPPGAVTCGASRSGVPHPAPPP